MLTLKYNLFISNSEGAEACLKKCQEHRQQNENYVIVVDDDTLYSFNFALLD